MPAGTRRVYGCDTWVEQWFPWGRFVKAKAICQDGKLRTLRFRTGIADTFYSVPAYTVANRKSVSGYMTFETLEGLSTETPDDPMVVKFIAYKYGKNWKEVQPK